MLALKCYPKFSVEGCCPVRDNKEANLWRHQTPHDAQLLVGAGPMTSACADRTSAYPASCTSMPCSLRSAGKEGAVRSVLFPSPPRRPGCCVSFTEQDGVARDAGRLPHAASTVLYSTRATQSSKTRARARHAHARVPSRVSPPSPRLVPPAELEASCVPRERPSCRARRLRNPTDKSLAGGRAVAPARRGSRPWAPSLPQRHWSATSCIACLRGKSDAACRPCGLPVSGWSFLAVRACSVRRAACSVKREARR